MLPQPRDPVLVLGALSTSVKGRIGVICAPKALGPPDWGPTAFVINNMSVKQLWKSLFGLFNMNLGTECSLWALVLSCRREQVIFRIYLKYKGIPPLPQHM